MRRLFFWGALVAFTAANVAAGFAYRQLLRQQLTRALAAADASPQIRLAYQRRQLEELRRAVADWERRAGYSLGDAIQFFDAAAVGWEEIVLETAEGSPSRLDVLSVKGLVGSTEQLTRVDRRLAPLCRNYRRTPTRDGKFILSCQLKPGKR